jgi:hypothetical protein
MDRTILQRKEHLRVDDLMCSRCAVQATTREGSVCELCRALGKSVDPMPKDGIWSDIRFGGICAKRFIFGLNA